ncbi:hypothetical protein L484_009819 [Morus notabilis]|uniref:DYW domain-containing protein n=1 Tax=Morus notabilis TaxID=981085 RepID=W9SCJ3_9ROSA|nr:putative pentatricopeptide repeat-containing protein At5g13230, mitochondrial [Morus notabilis]EXC25511.1 hypothetical protein L484_009819 [Morus notabilis]
MIRLFCQRTLPYTNPAVHSRINSWISRSQRGFSSLAVQLTQQCSSHADESPMPDFDSHSYAAILKECVRKRDSTEGFRLHCEILKRGNCLDLFASNILLNVYVKSGSISDANKLFEEMPQRNTISFVTLLQGFSESQRFSEALDLFLRLHREGHELNTFVFTSTLKLLVRMGWAEIGWCLHGFIYKLGHDSDAFVGSALIDAYTVCGCVDIARHVFKGIVFKDMVSWTGIVACYAENDCFEEALELFHEMRIVGFKPNNFTFTSVLKTCLGLGSLNAGKSIHANVIKSHYKEDQFVGLALLDLYTKFGNTADARRAFEEMPKSDVVSWSFMIARYAQKDQCEEALDLFFQMRNALVCPNQFTCASVLQACATMQNLVLGKQIHCHVTKVGLDLNVFVSNALMDVYAKCGKIENSMELFVQSPEKNDVTWNTMIVGYAQLGDGEKALSLFSSMLRFQLWATEVTYSSALRACASISALEPGLQIHSLTIKTTYDKDIAVGNAMIDMYAKCGLIKYARLVFDKLKEQDEVTWNAMISGYSIHGLGMEALKVFEMMQKTKCKPNKLTLVGVLSACSNAGLLEQGQAYFNSMIQDYGIEPCMEHYTCMIGLFGRLGHLNKAVKLIEEMPFEPSVMVWRALLGACVIHNNVELGKLSAQRVLEMEPQDDAAHVLLSNLYANAKRWNNVAFIRKSMKKKGVRKEPGLSWIETQGIVHYFIVGDTSHPDMKLISGMLEWLNMKTRRAGFVPNCSVVMRQVEDGERKRLLWLHSERLALAFGLIRTPSGSQIRIIKNLRICVDCHAAMKFVSKIVKRDILIRDMNRFHNFQDGICSCGDSW